VCSSAQWRKKFDCGFELLVDFSDFELSQGKDIRVQTIDLREINQGVAHIAVIVRDVKYSLHKSNGRWLVSDCVPTKKAD
jgi:hypothetical protein